MDDDLGFKPLSATTATAEPEDDDLGFKPIDKDKQQADSLENNLKHETMMKDMAQRQQFMKMQQQKQAAVIAQQKANDPKNMTYDQLKQKFKMQPAKTIQEDIQNQALLKAKKMERDEQSDALLRQQAQHLEGVQDDIADRNKQAIDLLTDQQKAQQANAAAGFAQMPDPGSKEVQQQAQHPVKSLLGAAFNNPLETITGKGFQQRFNEQPVTAKSGGLVEEAKYFTGGVLAGLADQTLAPINAFIPLGAKYIGKIPMLGTTLGEIATKAQITKGIVPTFGQFGKDIDFLAKAAKFAKGEPAAPGLSDAAEKIIIAGGGEVPAKGKSPLMSGLPASGKDEAIGGQALFNDSDPKYPSTMALPIEDLTPKNVAAKIAAKRREFQMADQAAKGSPQARPEQGAVPKLFAPVKQFLDENLKPLKITKNLEGDSNLLIMQNNATDFGINRLAKQLEETMGVTAKEHEQIYFHGEDPNEPLTPKAKEAFDSVALPLKRSISYIAREMGRLKAQIPEENYMPRILLDSGSIFDRLKSGVRTAMANTGSLLTRTAQAFKHRTMMRATTEDGMREVVSVKNDRVLLWKDNKPTDLGPLNIKKFKDLLEKELEPVLNQRKTLQTELRTLEATKGRMEASPIRIQNIKETLTKLEAKEEAVRQEYDPTILRNKVFVDKNGKKWLLGQATTKEIEANTPLKYSHNGIANLLETYRKVSKAYRAAQFLDGLKEDPEFNKIAMKAAPGNQPPNDKWGSVDMPQFRGYLFEPKTKDILNNFQRRISRGDDPAKVFTATNNFLRTAIFFNPLIHLPNIAVHWFVNRGLTAWFSPKRYPTLLNSARKAITDVWKQTPDYQKAMENGVNLLSYKYQGDYIKALYTKTAKELEQNPNLLNSIAKEVGQAPKNLLKGIYNFSGKVTWVMNDVATLQAIYEEQALGKSFETAISDVSKHIPNYIVPARVMGTTLGNRIMTDSNITMFGAYHYGALKSYGEMAKSVVKGGAETAEALDKLAALAVMFYGIYPYIADPMAKFISGNKDARFRRAGATTLLEKIGEFVQGKVDYAQALQSVLTPAVGTRAAVEAGFNVDTFTKKAAVNAGSEGSDVMRRASGLVSPIAEEEKIRTGKVGLFTWFVNRAGMTTTSPNKGKLFRMEDAKTAMQPKIEKLYQSNPDKAQDAADKFNSLQLKKLAEIAKEEKEDKHPPKELMNRLLVKAVARNAPDPDTGMDKYFEPYHKRKLARLNVDESIYEDERNR